MGEAATDNFHGRAHPSPPHPSFPSFSARRIAAAESQGASNGGQAAALAASLSRSIVMNESLSKRVLTLAESTRNAKLRGAPFRNVLFHGSPGNGKTMVARQVRFPLVLCPWDGG